MELMSLSYGVLWIVVLALAAAVAALARQIGVLHERLPPMGALLNQEGPAVGQLPPPLRLVASSGQEFQLGTQRAEDRPMLLLFVSGACPVCKRILPWSATFARAENVDLVLLAESDAAAVEAHLRELVGPRAAVVGSSSQAAVAFRVGKLPYAVVIDAAGVVAAKGLVNSREHLESLIVSTEIGFPSLQAYFTAQSGEARASHGAR
jgi:methylamine dehydrogenase accessory protein MauD